MDINGTKSDLLPVTCGVPQGSILGPLLFILYINDLVNVTKLADVIMFADDTNLFFNGKNLDDLICTVNAELQKFCLWFKLNKLSLNIKKTNFILFGRKQQDGASPKIYIDNTQVEKTNKTKFLGVIINQALTWTDHITVIKQKVQKSVGIISRLRNTLPQSIMISLYHTLVAPYYEYCNMVWAMESTTALNKLFVTQKRLSD